VGLLDSLGSFLTPLLTKIKQMLGPFGKLFDLIGQFWTGLTSSFEKGQLFAHNLVGEINAWKNFTTSIPYRTGVINIPKAVEQTIELINQIKAAWFAIVDIGKQIRKQVQGQTESPVEEAEEAVKDIESSGIKSLLEKFPKLAKGLEKVLGFLAILIGVTESIEALIDDLTEILDAVRGIREEVEGGSTVFLQQKNSRKALALKDGGSIRIRVGSLHEA
jgi:hypothetical protein